MIPPIRIPSSTASTTRFTCSRSRQFASSQIPTPKSQPRSRGSKWAKRGAVVGVVVSGLWVYDHQFNASAVTRSLRTAYIGLLCTLDYKINFSPSKADQIEALHERVANRLKWVIDTNQGLYLKLGQALGLQAALLPKPYREAFGHVFDRAPAVPYDEVIGVFQKDLSLNPLDVFETFSEEPLASASIAQVHKATLKPRLGGEGKEGRVVAVKVQKPAIEKQMEWDLFSYRSLMWMCEKLFDMPSNAKYVSSQMRLETSFTNEANNARRCAELLAQTPELKDDVYVPRVYGEAEGCKESDRIMVMEWVDGCRLNDKKQLEKWNLDLRETMDLAISTMSAMTFSWGFIHCDPHPGNILVRPHPTKKGKPQIILIDHGLYISLPREFREDYCTLWRSLFVLDVPKIENIARKWGIALDANMFASAILLRPFQVNKHKNKKQEKIPEKSQYEQQVELKARMKKMLENEQLIPRELIFLTRCQRMMQANNQLLGSPSSRVNLAARWASIGYTNSLTGSRSLNSVGLSTWLKDRLDAFVFRLTLSIVDLVFWFTLQKQRFLPKEKGGWEDKLQKQFEAMAKEEFGIEIDDTVFLG
ncbi:Atypical/ABC1/ABC1-B protein kinase [Kwoniella mangroviensis CBS 10435]|uniref:Atypical/ABC1/ABC1-B protein kinase n=1 Tax=Kwoniella mangroviensis CBS 10435 TaxID=1331196 RepID=A0A1B9IXW2_9TREE|nr:Atypical/ABC1/ABC1-B protein kinase [Kwoniella mangroviensis CBS 8507]OCF60359.1 Atypical/ABC1/ABC1-B protein kinase [Kwoniella mangroviensis CBS 10435]OCF69268.1 Atypical/ABC1/ABC1-B protein kinase [Kwoniella mangroviensis CBS 8507]OCF72524.1 Atypical/ABC1/ABC1-B protein kinase [Kwoniella mangroviensis CBS 8886]